MISQLPDELAQELENLAADEKRSPEEVLRAMFTQYRSRKLQLEVQAEAVVVNPAREAARAKLLAAGVLVTQFDVPEGAVRLSTEELLKIGKLPPGARSSLELINEDRGEW